MPTLNQLRPKIPENVGSRKVLSTRRGTIMVAVLAGLVALALLLVFLANYRDSVAGGKTVSVLVAARQLDEGTSGNVIAENELYTTSEIRESEEVDGAFTDPRSLRGQVSATTIYPGEQLSSADFDSGADPIAGKLEGTQRAISLPLDDAHGNVGQVEEGSRVDVLGGISAQLAGGTATPAVSVLARNVLVLRVKESTSGVGSSGDNQVTVRVSDLEANRIAFASDQGDVWLTIRPPTLAKDSAGG